MKLLVTGGAGFIGSNFVRYMSNKYPNYDITVIDSLTYAAKISNLDGLSIDFVQGDICDRRLVSELAKKVDVIINFAAESHVDRSIEDPSVFVKTNIEGTQVLLDAARENKLRYVQISTDEVYGSLGSTGLFTEETPLAPNSPYSSSKAGADLLVRAYYHTFNLDAVITRCSNNYGPYQYPEKLIPLFIKRLLNDQTVPVYGDGLNVRDWLYVEDHCSAIDVVLHKGKAGEVYNIGGNNEKTNVEITTILLNELGKPSSLVQYVNDRLGHDRRYAIDNTKIREELGWTPKYTFETGIKETIKWYLNNSTWLEA